MGNTVRERIGKLNSIAIIFDNVASPLSVVILIYGMIW